MPGAVQDEALTTPPERALELAEEAFARLDVAGVVAHLSAAIRGFTAAGQPRAAAMACARLGDAYANALGNLTAARVWFARGMRLVEREPPCVEQGWVALAAMGCDVDDPADLLARAELALDRARRFGDLNLETKALADGGLALVRAGRLDDGMAMLDEAMALACGPADDVETTSKSVCSFFTACYHAAAFERAGTWADLLRSQGLIGDAPMHPLWLSNHCDAVQATMLVELGRWGEADALLRAADERFQATLGMPSWHPAIHLADLRVRQGRLADAEALLLGKDQSMEALLPAARLHLARGEHDLAAAVIERGLRLIGDDRLRAVELLTMLVDVHLATGDLASARAACEALCQRTDGVAVPALRARAEAARARLLAESGEVDEAVTVVEAALAMVEGAQLPWLRVLLLIELVRLHRRAGSTDLAARLTVTAEASLAGLDVVLPPGAAEALAAARREGGQAGASTATLTREGRWWEATAGSTSVRLRDTKGLRYVAALVARPGVEQHALDLVDRVEGVAAAGGIDRRAIGDAGEVLDAGARAAYRRRIEVLREAIDDALDDGRLDEAEALRDELDQLVAQLAAAFGLGGRSRVAASAVERARLNVTRALRSALKGLSEALPEAGPALDRRIRTGTYCCYEPDGSDEVRWIVQS